MRLFKPSLTQTIFIGMAVGLVVGWLWPEAAPYAKPLSAIFLRLIQSIIAPLLFATLVTGIAGHGDLKQVGRLGLKALVYFEIVTTLALLLGLLVVNVVQPGAGVTGLQAAGAADVPAARPQSFGEILTHIVPQNIVEAVYRGEILQIVVFALFFSFALGMVPGEKRRTLLSFFDALAETMFRFTGIVMRYAPVGVGAAIAVTVGHSGLGVLKNLLLLVLSLYLAIALFVLFVMLPAAWIAKVPIGKFIRAVKEPALIAFSTTSSEAALPRAIELMEWFGVPKRIVSFVIPTGYSFNLDGSSLYLTLASVFVAQAAGVPLTWGQQAIMVFTLMLTSKGVAGVPRASLVILAATLASFHLPLEGVALILGVDELMDMGRSALNVVGNCLATAVVARWEGELPASEVGVKQIPPPQEQQVSPAER